MIKVYKIAEIKRQTLIVEIVEYTVIKPCKTVFITNSIKTNKLIYLKDGSNNVFNAEILINGKMCAGIL